MYTEVTINEFIRAASSSNPAPGGGGVSALCGSLAMALSQMVANITLQNKKFDNVKDDMKEILQNGEEIKQNLLLLIDEDAEAFTGFMEALRLPKNTEEEVFRRVDAMQMALKDAASVPMKIAEEAYKIMDLADMAIQKGNSNIVTDGIISAIMCRSAVLSAIINVRINLKSIKDEDYVKEVGTRCDELETLVKKREMKILENNKKRGLCSFG